MKKILIFTFVVFFSKITIAQVPCPTPSISGKLTYNNVQSTPLDTSWIYLKELNGVIIDSVVTDHYGNYKFCSIPNGTYKLNVKTSKIGGGINALDALLALKHFTGISLLTNLALKSADVNGNGNINSADALLIAKRFVNLITHFSIGDWVFEEPQVTVSGTISQIVNISGLSTGDLDRSFVPLTTWICGDTIIDQRDGQKYPTDQIGTQCWMKKNLNYGTMIPVTADMTNNGISEKYCLSNLPAYCMLWGGFYKWDEIMQYDTTQGIQGICPAGFHIPTNADWDLLSNFLGGDLVAGGKMKETGTTHWSAPNTAATNESGFTALGSGSITGGQSLTCNMWSSSQIDNTGAYYYYLDHGIASLIQGGMPKNMIAISVRCLKN